jgi:hypothetical protein
MAFFDDFVEARLHLHAELFEVLFGNVLLDVGKEIAFLFVYVPGNEFLQHTESSGKRLVFAFRS